MSDPSLAFPEHHPRQPLSRRGRVAILVAPVLAALVAGCTVAPSQAAPVEVTTPVATASVLPDPEVLSAKLRAVSHKGISSVAVRVVTPDGNVLANRAGLKPLTPASTMKLMTTMSALEALGPSTTFATRVVQAGTRRIILVGGGDPLLTNKKSSSRYKPASLQALAKATAKSLKAQGRTSIRLSYDASLFSGRTFNRYWKKRWRGYEAKVTALETKSGKLSRYRADPNPPRTAARAFAARLKKAGITVTSITSKKAAVGATELARVTSASLALIVKRTLLISDNVGAETISRHAALANGKAGSFSGASANVTSWLKAHGLWRTGQRIQDGSGLSPTNRLTADALTDAVRLALTDSTYRAVIAGLPVAAETGTLAKRFDDKPERAGRHTVHAKTGTLRGVAALAGYLTTRDGALLVFAELANSKQSASYERLYNWLDRSAAVTARCGCH